MVGKVRSILGSVRFWQIAIVAALQVAVEVGFLGAGSEVYVQALQGVLGVSVTIGTVDRFAERVGS